APIIKGGRIESGHITGGRIDIGNGNFTVDPDGNLTAKSGVFDGLVKAEKIEGDVVSVKRGVTQVELGPEKFNRDIMISYFTVGRRVNTFNSAFGNRVVSFFLNGNKAFEFRDDGNITKGSPDNGGAINRTTIINNVLLNAEKNSPIH